MGDRLYSIRTIYDTWQDTHGKPAVIITRQWARLANLIWYARARSRYYQKLYKGLPAHISDTKHLPVTTKLELMANFDDWVTDPTLTKEGIDAFLADQSKVGELYEGKYAVWTTSGVTGKPGVFVHDSDALSIYSVVVNLRSLPLFTAVNAIRGLSAILQRRGWAAVMVATGGHFGGVTAVELTRKQAPWLSDHVKVFSVLSPLPEIVEELNRFRPAIVFGYPTAISLLAQEQVASRLHIDPVFVATTGEWLSPADRQYITSAFNCEVRDYYGTSEFPPAALDCGNGWLHTNPDWEILEPVDQEYRPVPPGVPSHTVLLTNLANRVQPIIRYDLGDSITVNPDPCACGCSLPSIKVEGRRSDILSFTAADGTEVRLLPLTLSTVIEETPGVKSFQLIQREPLVLSLRLETKPEAADQQVWESVTERLLSYLSEQGLFSIQIVRDPELPHRDPISGKFRQIWVDLKVNP